MPIILHPIHLCAPLTVLVDAAQATGRMPIDVARWDCDFLAFSGHKIYGPTGIGVLYVKNERLEEYVVPMSYNIRWYVHINLRALIWLTEIRSTPQGHTGYRKIAQEMFKKVEAVQPLLAKYMKFIDLNEMVFYI